MKTKNILTLIWYLSIFGVLSHNNIHAQDSRLDSLYNLTEDRKLPAKEKIQMYYDLSWEYLNINFDKSTACAHKALALAEKENDDVLMQGKLWYTLGSLYQAASRLDSAIIFYNNALECTRVLQNETFNALVYFGMGNVYNDVNNSSEALLYYIKALPEFEKSNKKKPMVVIYRNMGSLYFAAGNLEQAELYISKSIAIAKEIDDKSTLSRNYSELSTIAKNRYQYEESMKYARLSLEYAEATNDKVSQSGALLVLSQYYLTGIKDYAKAETYSLKSLQLAEEIGYPGNIAKALSVLSFIYYEQGKYDQSETYALKAFEMDTIDSGNIKSSVLINLIRLNTRKGDIEKATGYLYEYRDYINRKVTKDFQQAMAEMEVKYEAEKKEMKISAMEDERRFILWLSITGGVLLLVVLAFFIVRQRLAKQQVKQLEQEKQLVATQAVLDGETSERTRLARDLHDGLGGMLSVVKLKLNDVRKGASLEGEDVQRFEQALHTLDDSIQELRRVAHHMMPDSLSRYGLKASLTDFCNSVPGAEFHYFGDGERLDSKLEVMIYRTVHELVNNALKHAGAKRIIVQIVQEADRVALTVQDDGCGFDTAAPTKGVGLQNIRNRVASYNGNISIWSEPGKGTEISIEVNIPQKVS